VIVTDEDKAVCWHQGISDMPWLENLPSDVTAGTVLKSFCREYALSHEDCDLCRNGQSLSSSQSLQQVKIVLQHLMIACLLHNSHRFQAVDH